ncbi:hypothetical protein SeMB42_g06746 [Synchytrium endobioticum]|uniref:Gfo/Idh/MocA-like oxidoreductase N-terminal domain-containing protein n=1 Tax=Synchytrium endobioticum TaxID=286115 RepID=A0A507CJM1_9FUNG|nr:hypothetical protein SeLEV6574_g07859 [Synchytrium endobioticum]TPX38424.1 hypothetical protein SeMB42_g06746 [Synchytrium endobioticum]
MEPMSVLMVGTGEYTTGFVHAGASLSDKKVGVVALVLFDMRLRGKIGRISAAGKTGRKNQMIRDHLKRNIGNVYRNVNIHLDLYPADGVDRDVFAYKHAMDRMSPGDAVTIFTPDDTHYEIALYAIRKRLHVLIAKPCVKTLREHQHLIEEAETYNVLVVVEYHKRFDPIYADARERIRTLGDFSFMAAYMSQPKFQLNTFKSWAGKTSDISYYLNSHHIDLHLWAISDRAKPIRVTASASTGVATSPPYECESGTEDTITLMVQWKNTESGNLGTAVYTSSWIAPKAEVHSQQRFFYMGHKGEIRVDQAHRGYEIATDDDGVASINPLFMRYTPDGQGRYAGQGTYGHKSIECWADACIEIKNGRKQPQDFVGVLATIQETVMVTAVLEAGRRSLDDGGKEQVVSS